MAPPYCLRQYQTRFEELFAAEGLAGGAFGDDLFLDHHLGGDAGVVGAREPEGLVAEHAVPADEDVHLGLVEHVAHVEAAGDVGRRQENREGVAGCCFLFGRESVA